MDFSGNSKISKGSSFQLIGNSNNNSNQHKNMIDSLNNLTKSLNRNLTGNIYDFMKCFICLGRTKEPITCPKCNNFACQKCFETYFDGQNTKACPLCKQIINYNQLKYSKIIPEIENILNKEVSKSKKVELLIILIKEKKNIWENQNNYINNIIEKILKYQEIIKDYKKQYDFFLLNCKEILDKIFNDYYQKIEELTNSLLSYNKNNLDPIQKYNDIDKNYQNDLNNNYIKDLINELLSMERKSFNQSKKEKDDFFINISTKIAPSLIFYKIRDIKIKKEDFNKYSNLSTKGNHYKLGNYLIKYKFNTNEGFKSLCELSFNFIDNSNTCFLFTQNKVDKKNEQNLFPMKFTKKNGNEYIFQCIISFDEFDNEKEDEVRMEIEALVFSI